jgi:glycosyltransferase involved in cell wall biosynthesis
VLQALIDLGWIDLEDLPLLIGSADVAIYLMDDTLLNRTKCPVKLADLLSAGIPVVAEAVGQVPEYVLNGHTGCLRRSGDVAGLIADTANLLQNKRERTRMRGAAREHYVNNFTWDRLAARLERAYGITK